MGAVASYPGGREPKSMKHASDPAPACAALQVQMCLVVNKVDRLILELRLTPGEAYERIKSIIAHVNMVVSSFQSGGGRQPSP